MINASEAFGILNAISFKIQSDQVALSSCRGRFLSAAVASTVDSPPFDKAAMDGYALPDAGTAGSYAVEAVIPAGEGSPEPLKAGSCRPIMTGAPVPPGTRMVIQVENCNETGGMMTIEKPASGSNIIRRAENIAKGDRLLGPGLLSPAKIGIAAASGYASLPCAKLPVVHIINTGNEILEPGEPLRPGTIYNSNGPQLRAQLQECGIEAVYSVVEDNRESLTAALGEASAQADLILLSGGVSAGRFDFVPESAAAAGYDTLFHKVAIKPGKPVLVCRKEDASTHGMLIGLPGNPVSVFVLFELMVKPLLAKMQGGAAEPKTRRLAVDSAYSRRNSSRREYRPGRLTDEGVEWIAYHGSSHLNGYEQADCLICIEKGDESVEKGCEVDVVLL